MEETAKTTTPEVTQTNTSTPPEPAITKQAPPSSVYTIPVHVPGDLFNHLVSLSNESSVSVSDLSLQLINKAANSELLSGGTITEISDDAQEVIKGLSYDALLEAMRIYNVAKEPVSESTKEIPRVSGVISFVANPETSEIVKQINDRRVVKGLAPLEKSLCEMLYHYSLSLGDNQAFEPTTGIKLAKFKSTMKALALNERDSNGSKSNLIETASIFGGYTIVETPEEPENEQNGIS